MIDYLKSKALKEYHKKLNFVLPDEAVATLIEWEPHTCDFSHELGDQTSQRI